MVMVAGGWAAATESISHTAQRQGAATILWTPREPSLLLGPASGQRQGPLIGGFFRLPESESELHIESHKTVCWIVAATDLKIIPNSAPKRWHLEDTGAPSRHHTRALCAGLVNGPAPSCSLPR